MVNDIFGEKNTGAPKYAIHFSAQTSIAIAILDFSNSLPVKLLLLIFFPLLFMYQGFFFFSCSFYIVISFPTKKSDYFCCNMVGRARTTYIERQYINEE